MSHEARIKNTLKQMKKHWRWNCARVTPDTRTLAEKKMAQAYFDIKADGIARSINKKNRRTMAYTLAI